MENKIVKVLFIVPSLDPGGIETYLLRFLKFIHKDEAIKPYLLVRNLNKGALYDQYEALEIPIYFQPLGYFNLKNIKYYFNLFKKQQFDTVCDFNANFAGMPIWLSKKSWHKKSNNILQTRQKSFSLLTF